MLPMRHSLPRSRSTTSSSGCPAMMPETTLPSSTARAAAARGRRTNIPGTRCRAATVRAEEDTAGTTTPAARGRGIRGSRPWPAGPQPMAPRCRAISTSINRPRRRRPRASLPTIPSNSGVRTLNRSRRTTPRRTAAWAVRRTAAPAPDISRITQRPTNRPMALRITNDQPLRRRVIHQPLPRAPRRSIRRRFLRLRLLEGQTIRTARVVLHNTPIIRSITRCMATLQPLRSKAILLPFRLRAPPCITRRRPRL